MTGLCAVTTVSNPANYKSRFNLYREFRARMAESGVTLYTIELATGDQPFVVTAAGDSSCIQVRSPDIIWYKENLFNVALRMLPKHCDNVALLDADIQFIRPDWVEETLNLLKRHAFVQMFSHVIDLGPRFEPLKIQEGFAHRRQTGTAESANIGQTGYAWAMQREALERLGGLIDCSILGSNDYFMALALAGAITPEATRMPGSSYAETLLAWQQKCLAYRDIGCLDTTILHFWHGRRKDRGYDQRWRILADNSFDPATDLARDASGLLTLAGNKPALRDAIGQYFAARNEDAVEI